MLKHRFSYWPCSLGSVADRNFQTRCHNSRFSCGQASTRWTFFPYSHLYTLYSKGFPSVRYLKRKITKCFQNLCALEKRWEKSPYNSGDLSFLILQFAKLQLVTGKALGNIMNSTPMLLAVFCLDKEQTDILMYRKPAIGAEKGTI